MAVLLMSACSLAIPAEVQTTEYRVKTAFLYNFSRFVTWPEAALRDRTGFSLCVIGSDPFGTLLDKLAGKTVQNHPLVVRRLGSLAMLDDCQLVYIGKNAALDDVLLLLGEKPVLTVSEATDFVEQGGIIQFTLVQNKVRFRINVDAASNAGLIISSKLLSLAISVTGED
jgi:hypothetical protein